jgi:UDP-N-acetylmuramate--alanine ligase
MNTLPLPIGTIHFCGIGGIGMSGIAEVLHNLGYTVQGSDLAEGANVRRLIELGIPVSIGHHGANLGDAEVLVISSAVKSDNPEVAAARERMIPVVRRAEMLAELMRLKRAVAVGGTHGKTTTTSIIAAVLDAAGLDPTVINGGIINAYGTNARLGTGEWIVVEADESDGTFVKLPATIAVVTNIDAEHLDFYGSFDDLRRAFVSFVENIPFYGLAVLCVDHPEVQALIPRLTDRRIVTYGITPQADIRAENIETAPGRARFDVRFSGRAGGSGRLDKLDLPMTGVHNVQNALAAVAIAREMSIADDIIRRGLETFGGVKRRFTVTGQVGGITVVDDYAHHPVEISAVLAAGRSSARRNVIAVVQPHRYSRLQNLFDEFCTCCNDADTVIVADVYPAGETPIEGIDRDALVTGLRDHGHRNVIALEGADALAGLIAEIAEAGDYVLCLGAGSITQWANDLPGRLESEIGSRPAPRSGAGA